MITPRKYDTQAAIRAGQVPGTVFVSEPDLLPEPILPSPETAAALKDLADDLRQLRQREPQVTAELEALREQVNSFDDRVSVLELERTIDTTAPTAAPLLRRIFSDPAFHGALSTLGLLVAVLTLVLTVS